MKVGRINAVSQNERRMCCCGSIYMYRNTVILCVRPYLDVWEL